MRVRIRDGGRPPSEVDLVNDEYLVGRGNENDVPIQHNSVSRQHARIVRTPEGIRIVDLGSRNGLHLHGVKVTSTPVFPGDIVVLSPSVQLEFEESARPLAPPPRPPIPQQSKRPTRVTKRLIFCSRCQNGNPSDNWKILPVPGRLKEPGGRVLMELAGDDVEIQLEPGLAKVFGLFAWPGRGALVSSIRINASHDAALSNRSNPWVPLLVFAVERPLYAKLVEEEPPLRAVLVEDEPPSPPTITPAVAASRKVEARPAPAPPKPPVVSPPVTQPPPSEPPPVRHETWCTWECGPEDVYCPGCGRPQTVPELLMVLPTRQDGLPMRPGAVAIVWDDEIDPEVCLRAGADASSLEVEDPAVLLSRGRPLVEVVAKGREARLRLTAEGRERLDKHASIAFSIRLRPGGALWAGRPAGRARELTFPVLFARRPVVDLELLTPGAYARGGKDQPNTWKLGLLDQDLCVAKITTSRGEFPPMPVQDAWTRTRLLSDPPAPPSESPVLRHRGWAQREGEGRIALRWGPSSPGEWEFELEPFPRVPLRLRVETYRDPVEPKTKWLESPAKGDLFCRLPVDLYVHDAVTLLSAKVVDLPNVDVLTDNFRPAANVALTPGAVRLLVQFRGGEGIAEGRRIRLELTFPSPRPPVVFPLEMRNVREFEVEDDYLSIDFGTSATCCAYTGETSWRPEALLLGDTDRPEIPSALFFEDVNPRDPVYQIGDAARSRMEGNPCGYIDRLKQMILTARGGSVPVWVHDGKGGEVYDVERLVELYLRAVILRAQDVYERRTAAAPTGRARKLAGLNLTFPASAPTEFRNLLRRVASRLDGLDGVLRTAGEAARLIVQWDEARSGALGSLIADGKILESPDSPRFHLLLDSGGGTVEVLFLALRGDPIRSPDLRLIAAARGDELSGAKLTGRIAELLRDHLLLAAESGDERYPWQEPGRGEAHGADEAGIHNYRVVYELAERLKVELLGIGMTGVEEINLANMPRTDAVQLLAWREPGEKALRPLRVVAEAAARDASATFDVRRVTARVLESLTGWRDRLIALWKRVDRMVRGSGVDPAKVTSVLLVGRGCKLRMVRETALQVLPWAREERVLFDERRAKPCVSEGAAHLETSRTSGSDVFPHALCAGPRPAETRPVVGPGRVRYVSAEELDRDLQTWNEAQAGAQGFRWEPERWFPLLRMEGSIVFYVDRDYADGLSDDLCPVCKVVIPGGLSWPLRGFLLRQASGADELVLYAKSGDSPPQLVLRQPLEWV